MFKLLSSSNVVLQNLIKLILTVVNIYLATMIRNYYAAEVSNVGHFYFIDVRKCVNKRTWPGDFQGLGAIFYR